MVHHTGPYEKEAGGPASEKDVETEAGVRVTCCEDGGKGHQPRNAGRAASRNGKDREHNPANTLISNPARSICSF